MSRSRPPCRPFGLDDALVLVAATGLAFGLGRALQSDVEIVLVTPRLSPTERRVAVAIIHAMPFVTPTLLSLAGALMLLRLRRPRPRRPALWRQPGFLAGAAVLGVIGWRMTCLGCCWIAEFAKQGVAGPSPWKVLPPVGEYLSLYRPTFGVVVALVWLTAWAAGAWRPEPGWIDRSGRVVGVIWIVLACQAMA